MGKSVRKGSRVPVNDKKKDRYIKQELKKNKNRGRFSKDEETCFSLQLESQGLKYREMGADGNCLFRSIADQLEGIESRQDYYRQTIMVK